MFESIPEIFISIEDTSGKQVTNRQVVDGVYTGTFKGSNRNGYGVLLNNDFSLFEGAWSNNMKHGHGRLITTDGTIIEG